MIRTSKLDEYGNVICSAVNDLFRKCEEKQASNTDLLVCYQNGFKSWDNSPAIGLGIEGLDSIQGLNQVFGSGIGECTNRDDYFKTLKPSFYDGMSSFEKSLMDEMNRYLVLWENSYFLRLLIQLGHLVNGEHYDWDLNIKKQIKKRGNIKSNVIEEDILKRFKIVPSFDSVLQTAYHRDIRNGVAHSQCVIVQGGIMIKDLKSNDDHNIKGLSFEQWEKVWVYSYVLGITIKQGLKSLSDEYTSLLQKNRCGVRIMIPTKDGGWDYGITYPYTYPNRPEPIWRFSKPDWAL